MTLEINEKTYAAINKRINKDSFYKQLFEELPIGYAFLTIIYNEQNKPYDYEFQEVNPILKKEPG